MHAVFIPYGKRSEVELMLRDMEAQKHLVKFWKGKEKKSIWMQGGVRVLPLGLMDYTFPREDLDLVLTSLKFNDKRSENRYNIGILKLALLRKITGAEKIPEFNTEKKFMWITENVAIIPIGIKEDKDLIDNTLGENFGWSHEAI